MDKLVEIFARYFLAAVLGFFFFFFSFIFFHLTIYPVYFLLSILYPVSVIDANLIISSKTIELIPACIAGSAHYLLTALNLTTPMKLKKRFPVLFFSLILFLIINISRIFFISLLFIESNSLFDFTHKFSWYFLSTVFIIGIWFFSVYLLKIKSIPVYSDFKYLLRKIKTKKVLNQ